MSKTNWKYVQPHFEHTILVDQLREGYWIEAPDIDGDGKPDLIGYGTATGEVYSYHNPEWTRTLIASGIREPVGSDISEISGNGCPDLVICHALYGEAERYTDPDPQGGKILWLENPGRPGAHQWKQHPIGRGVGMHRIRAGHFTQTERVEVLGFPIVALQGTHAVLPIYCFTQPDKVLEADSWPSTIISDSDFRFIHGASKKTGLVPNSALDSVILASEEGVTWMYHDESTKTWTKVPIGTGETTEYEKTGFKGSGDADVGGLGNDPFAYVAAMEPFHGNTLAVYCKASSGHPGQVQWKRFVLDVFGDPNEKGEGPGHHVVCRDFDKDGDDEFLIALRGPWPWQGVFYYKAVDLANGVFAKWRVSNESAARVAVADFSGSGRLDFATIGYNVEHYYTAKDTKVAVFLNKMRV